MGAKLLAAVVESKKGRSYIAASDEMERTAAFAGENSIASSARSTFLSGKTPTRSMITGGVCSAYGLDEWGDLFTDRQIVALRTFSDLVDDAREHAEAQGASSW